MCGIAGMMTLNGEAPPVSAAAGDGGGAAPSRPRRRRALSLGRCRHGADPARDHRSGDRRPAALRAGRRGADRQWRDLQLHRAARRIALRAPGRFLDAIGLRAAAASLSPTRARLHRASARHVCVRAARSGDGRLVLARDPFGIKPLYYAETAHGFAFASEPRCADRGRHRLPELVAGIAQRIAAAAIHHRPRDDLRRHRAGAAGRDGGRAPGADRRAPAACRLPAIRTGAARRRARRWPGSIGASPRACACISAPTCRSACSSPGASIRRRCWR